MRRAFAARLTLLHVIEPPPTPAFAASSEASKLWYEAQLQHANEFLAELSTELGTADAERAIEMGYPSDVICREAEERDADLIVLGRSGHRPGTRLTVGSVGSNVAAAATRSVTIVR